jgi:hypothetical protein
MRNEDAPKSGRVRSVPMIDQVAVALDQLSRRNGWMCLRWTRPKSSRLR